MGSMCAFLKMAGKRNGGRGRRGGRRRGGGGGKV